MGETHQIAEDHKLVASFRHHWWRRILAASFACALGLGTVGYLQYDPELRPLAAFYHSAQHFTMHGPHLQGCVP
jgi:hypothetical protein